MKQKMQQKKVIIIPNENMYDLKTYAKKCENSHKEGFREFINVTGLSIPEVFTSISSQEMAYHLAEHGFITMLYANQNDKHYLTVYLPLQMSEKQQQYFIKRELSLINFNLSIFAQNENNGFTHLKYIQNKRQFDILMDAIEERCYQTTKAKTKKLTLKTEQ